MLNTEPSTVLIFIHFEFHYTVLFLIKSFFLLKIYVLWKLPLPTLSPSQRIYKISMKKIGYIAFLKSNIFTVEKLENSDKQK